MTKNLKFIPLTKWSKFHAWPSVEGLRWLVRNSDKNGFKEVFIKKRGRILINETAFYKWLLDEPTVGSNLSVKED